MAPSPNLFLASAAQRTQRLRLGPLVQLLPLYNPLRNIEEVCSLDSLTNGRLELGVGRGISAPELAIYNVDFEESRDRFRECLDILLMGLSTGHVSYEGRYYTIKDADIPLRTVQRPYPPLWYPTSNAESVPWLAKEGFNTLLGFARVTNEQTATEVKLFRSLLEEHHGEEGRLNGHVPQPRCGVNRHIYVAETDDEAMSVARSAYEEFDRNFRTRPGRNPDDPSRRGDFTTAISYGTIMTGSPETVRGKVQQFIDETGADYLCGTFAFGSLTTDQVLSSMRLFSSEVMPKVKPAAVGA
jgi:alkanesulfonate monooxygenase SsuD/methylene tetrahydromethanopterin reductase-like flavin-dependent oxidoreductase (luciferase family)